MASKYTIPGRAGFDYQDIVALDLVVEMMTHPDRYQWIQVESDDAGCLDDVTALKGNGEFIYWQVKFAVDPEVRGDSYNWKKLLEQEKGEDGPKDSLLMRWEKSLSRVMQQGPVSEAALITNRKAAADLNRAFKDFDLVDFDKIQSSDTKKEIRKQVGSVKAARAFFSKFHFKMNHPGLEAWEQSVKRKFELLGGTAEGWLSLKDNMRTWARQRKQPPPDGLITLEKARKAALWEELRRMPQEFEIPPDYVVPSQDFHEVFMEKVRDADQRCIVLTAPPGTGKSTYLSHVVRECRNRDIPVIRHHYFLSLRDRTPNRLVNRRVAESLMNDLKQCYPKSIGTKINTNPNPDDLGQWLDHCGKQFAAQGQALVVIIDGLDHVARDKGCLDEVRELLYHLLPPPEGVTIVVGTQPLERPKVPKRLLDYAPYDSWEQLPCLNRSGVRLWVEKNSEALGLAGKDQKKWNTTKGLSHSEEEFLESRPEQERLEVEIDNLAGAFWEVSGGHPLHLRYCMNYLSENNLPITPTTVRELPPCSGGDIVRYYRGLFDSVIDERGREILHLMAACRFDWPEEGILETMDPDGTRRADFVQAMKSIKHLTRQTDLGLTAFHISILHFIADHEGHKLYRDSSRHRALDWLRSRRSPDYLRWANEWMLAQDLGDRGPLIKGPDRIWAVNSLIERYPPNETLRILSESCNAALNEGLVSTYLKTALQRDYVDGLYEGHEAALETMLEPQLVLLRGEDYLLTRLSRGMSSFTPQELVILARDAAERGDHQILRDIFDHLQDRIDRPGMRLSFDDLRQPLVRVAALCKDVNPMKVVEYVEEEEKGAVFPYLASAYASELRRAKRVDAFGNLLPNLGDGGHIEILQQAALLNMEQRIRPSVNQWPNEVNDPYSSVWMQLSDVVSSPLNVSFPPLTGREKERYHEPGDYESTSTATLDELREAFFCFLAHHLDGRPDQNATWLAKVGEHSYEGRFLHKLNEVSRDLAATVKKGVPASLGFVYERLKGFEPLEPGADPESWALFRSVKRAAVQVGLDVIVIGLYMGARPEISQYEIELAFNSQFCDWAAWTEIYHALGRPWMSKEAVTWLLARMFATLEDSIETFPDRALGYAQMAVLACSHGLVERAAEYVRLTAENLLGYGCHKDILLFEVIDALRDCHDAGIEESKNWIVRLAPAITRAKDFTDGDMTRYLPERLAEVLARMDPRMLLRYYKWLLSTEDYYASDKAFAAYLRTAELSSSFGKAVASTTLETACIEILAKRAEEGDPGAAEGLLSVASHLGRLPVPPEQDRSENVQSSRYVDREDIGPNPSDYPPDRFADYLVELWQEQRPILRHNLRVESWVRYWVQTGKSMDAFEAMRWALDHGIEFHVSDDLFGIALNSLGNDAAFVWLVQAHGRNKGWRKYWIDRKHSAQRWKIVKERYPQLWLEFLVKSAALEDELGGAPYGKEKIQRLIQYSISVGQNDMAKELGEVVTQFICELLSPVTLPRPGWVPENA